MHPNLLKTLSAAALIGIMALCVTSVASARSFALDGNLSDWTEADRLDSVAGSGVDGFKLYGYHDAVTHKYHVALTAGQAIGTNTTFWLNTDGNQSTGYLVWGVYAGAEWNINISTDGAPHLYTGADGETWSLGPLSHAYNAAKTVFEVEFDEAMVASNTAIKMWVDVNNSVFLPSWYGLGGYTFNEVDVSVPPIPPTTGGITVDGDLSDWNPNVRLDRRPGTGVVGYELYGRSDGQTYYFAIRSLPPVAAPGANTTLWLNTDRNRATGYKVWGIAVGAEYNINFAGDGTPHLYSGAAAQTWLTGPLPHGRSPDGAVIEIALDQSLLPSSALSIDISLDVNNAVFVPADFTGPGYTLFHLADLPPRSPDRPVRVGILFSATSAAKYFADKAYSQLYAAIQHQCMQAGIPFTLLEESDLADMNKIKDFDALILPYFAHLPAAAMQEVEDTLVRAVYHYNIGLITAGNFLTNDENGNAHSGDSYGRMKHVLGVTLDGYFGPDNYSFVAGADHPIVRSYAPGEVLGSYAAGYLQYYKQHFSVAKSFAQVITSTSSHSVAWAVELGGRSVHFSSPAVMADTNLIWRAVLWSIYGDQPWVGMQVTRQAAVVVGRCDMDQSQDVNQVQQLYGALMPIIATWQTNYNFVGSYFVNIGNKPNQGQTTNWAYSAGIYNALIDAGNEIGTHSYTHPNDTTLLTEAQLTFEFKDSRDIISAQLGIDVVGAAVPGNPENLAVDALLDNYFSYASADFSGTGAGYHGAVGFLKPDSNMVYLAPSFYFDFTMIGFLGYTAAQALAKWREQYDALAAHASSPFMVWPWHDYGPTSQVSASYNEAMYTGFISYAFAHGAEFTTGAEAAERIISLTNAGVRVDTVDSDTLKVRVGGDVATGAMALRVETSNGRKIGSVDTWPAFNGDRVLLGEAGGTYVIHLSATGATTPHISKLPMRARLKAAGLEMGTGGSGELTFTFTGKGAVDVSFPGGTYQPAAQGGDATTYNSNVLSIAFITDGDHSCVVTW